MRTFTEKQFVVVEADTGMEYQEAVNAYYHNPDYSGVVVDHRNRDNFCAFITYEVTKRVPETIKDQYELDGVTFTCSDCPFLERKEDGRIRRFKCLASEQSGEEWSRRESDACEYFYEALQSGTLMEAMKEVTK